MAADDKIDLAATRRRMLAATIAVLPLAALAWLALYFWTPPVPGSEDPVNRFGFALSWVCIAVLLTLVSGIEAVAHERLFTPAIDPLAGRESRRLRINLRYLQNTLEQIAVFVPALLLLAWQAGDGFEMRAVTATAIVWMALRFVFWIGYHRAPELRAPGLVGFALAMIVLIAGIARFGYQYAGWPGALAPLLIFGAIEAYLVWISLRAGRG
ncbi:MAG: hypothetical protein ABS76_17950 [Pelagibacterium sp. SCN 64-44]|nr:MAG: hypothetical protein ABS76_17950 [Pelagibacterium sp. SCN 64-44]